MSDETRTPGAARRGAVRRLGLRMVKAAVMCALMVGSAELAGVLFLRVVQRLNSGAIRREKAEIYERLPTLQYTDNRPEQPVLNRPRELHPFFGFVLQRDQAPGNNHGFWNDVDFPYVPAADELVVGVFGGSVAVQMACLPSGRKVLEERFAALAAKRGFHSVRVLSLADSGWRQPQGFYTFVYYFAMVDVAIFLDGFNEVNQLEPRSWPERYPWAAMWQALAAAGGDPKEIVLAGEISWLSRLTDRWTKFFSGTVTGRSAILHCIWREGASRLMKAIDARRERLTELQSRQMDYSNIMAKSPQEALDRIQDYYGFYAFLSRWQWRIAEDEGVAYYHFIQPSHLAIGSKPWSSEERAQVSSYHERRSVKITEHYKRLENMTDRLAESGIPIYNLRDVFLDIAETVYVDETVHLNPLGLKLLTEAIMDRIALDFDQKTLRRERGR